MSDEQPAEDRPAASTPRPAAGSLLPAALIVLVVLFGVAAAYVVGANRTPAAATAAAPQVTDPAQSGMLVTGTGSAAGVPDQLRFTVTVHHAAADVTAAMDATSIDTRKVVRALTAQRVDKRDIRTAGVSVEPTYRYSGGQELITGYAATERVTVKVRDIKIAGKVISATANAAGNAIRIGGIAMSVADPTALQAQARALAIADARTKAEQFAKATGRELGAVVVVEESSPEVPDTSLSRGLLDSVAETAGRVPIQPGTQTTRVYVKVRWSFA